MLARARTVTFALCAAPLVVGVLLVAVAFYPRKAPRTLRQTVSMAGGLRRG